MTTHQCLVSLGRLGFTPDDAQALRRISMTLQRWFELECGDGNSYGSWAIERDETTEKPFMVHYHFNHGNGKDTVSRNPIADRERGARARLAQIMSRYPALVDYVQTDPRGAALYILTRADIPAGAAIDSIYNRGVAVYK